MYVLRLVEKMHLNNLNDEGIFFCNTLADQSLLNKKGLLVMLHNVDLYWYYEKLGNLKPLKFGKNEACP
jgi:hypothetical protein